MHEFRKLVEDVYAFLQPPLVWYSSAGVIIGERGMSYDAALQALAGDGVPLDFQRMIILSSYCEFTGKLPESTDPASQNHLTML